MAKRPGEALTPVEDRLLAHLAAQAGLVLRNARLTEELRARLDELQRLAAAARARPQDEERRRIERNLHDGAQQQLVALAVKLRLAEDARRTRPGRGRRRCSASSRRTTAGALEDLRDLARGIYPPLLADQGLGAALQAQAGKAPVPVDGRGRRDRALPAGGRGRRLLLHPGGAAERREVRAAPPGPPSRLAGSGRHLEFSVTDDGAGFDTAPRRDTAPACRAWPTGWPRVGGDPAASSSQPGHGTTVTGRLPAAALEPVP